MEKNESLDVVGKDSTFRTQKIPNALCIRELIVGTDGLSLRDSATKFLGQNCGRTTIPLIHH